MVDLLNVLIGFFGDPYPYPPWMVILLMIFLGFVLLKIDSRFSRGKSRSSFGGNSSPSASGGSGDDSGSFNQKSAPSASKKKSSNRSWSLPSLGLGKIFSFLFRRSDGSSNLFPTTSPVTVDPLDRMIWFVVMVMYFLLFMAALGGE